MTMSQLLLNTESNITAGPAELLVDGVADSTLVVAVLLPRRTEGLPEAVCDLDPSYRIRTHCTLGVSSMWRGKKFNARQKIKVEIIITESGECSIDLYTASGAWCTPGWGRL